MRGTVFSKAADASALEQGDELLGGLGHLISTLDNTLGNDCLVALGG